MAKLIQKIADAHGNYSILRENEAVQSNLSEAVALYRMEPSISGNVDFVLFLSGNSTFRVDVVAFEE